MKLLRKDTDYALAAIVYLAKHADSHRLSTTEIANALELPHGFLRKILKTLCRQEIISSSAGRNGGFELTCDPGKLSVYSVIKAVQGPIHGTECAVNRLVCRHTQSCPVRRIMNNVEKKLKDELDRIVISDLINS